MDYEGFPTFSSVCLQLTWYHKILGSVPKSWCTYQGLDSPKKNYTNFLLDQVLVVK